MSDREFGVNLSGTLSLDDLTSAMREEAAADAAAPSTAEEGNALVTVIRQGKAGSITRSVEVGTSVTDLMRELGWEYAGHDFKMTTSGQLGILSFDTPSAFKFGPGEHNLIVQPKVSGGLF